nr:dihydrofolate reductase [Desulfobulbaceae bacterium]
MELTIIVAMSMNRVIGRGAAIPWHIPGEQLQFKKVTMGHALIMGRKTFESIGRPLPGRRNIVVSRNKKYRADGCDVVSSLNEAINLCAKNDKVFVIGGAQIFEQAISYVQTIILTTVLREVEGDIYFPAFEGFLKISEEKIAGPDPYIVEKYVRQ